MTSSGNSIYSVTLEHGTDGSYLGWVDDVPGCAVRGRSRQEVVDRLPEAIRDFLAWAGDDVPAGVAVEVHEEVQSAIEAEEDTEVLVRADRQPLTTDDWRRADEWRRRSRDELLGLLDTLSEEQLASARQGSERTIREEIEHIAFVEFMYAVWTFDLQSKQGLAEFLAWTRELASERMTTLAARGDGRPHLGQLGWSAAARAVDAAQVCAPACLARTLASTCHRALRPSDPPWLLTANPG